MQDTMRVLYYPRCGTCRKALKWLDEANISYEKANIVEEPPTYDELKGYFERSGLPIKRFFNTSGGAYRNLNMKDRWKEGISDEECLELLASDPMLVKRPIVATGDVFLIGFKEDEWKAALLGQDA